MRRFYFTFYHSGIIYSALQNTSILSENLKILTEGNNPDTNIGVDSFQLVYYLEKIALFSVSALYHNEEVSLISGQDENRRSKPRQPFIADVDLIIDADTLKAMTVDISASGIRIDMALPLRVTMRFVEDGQLLDRKAQLARVQKTPDDGMTYGFEFIEESD